MVSHDLLRSTVTKQTNHIRSRTLEIDSLIRTHDGPLLLGAGFHKGGDFVEIQSETLCPCIGFISDKYRVSQELLKNGGHYIVDFQFKLP